jgi:hypothetical protein
MDGQLMRNWKKAVKEHHIPAAAYYKWLLSRDLAAASDYETFKNSSAFDSWVQKKGAVDLFLTPFSLYYPDID